MSKIETCSSVGEPEDDSDIDVEDEQPQAKKRFTGDSDTKPDRMRIAHSTAEKKRRDAIKDAYANLTSSIKVVSEEEKKKLTRAEVLDLAYFRAETLKTTIEAKKAERDALQKKLSALKVISEAYDSMPKTSEKSSIPPDLNCVVSNNIKLKLFTTLILKQFESFSGVMNTENLSTLATSLFYWVEVHWRPVDLKEYLIGLLKVLRNRFVNKSVTDSTQKITQIGASGPSSSSRPY
ncbi:hypothetical protein ACHWQZ_G014345 [Mnemiopsis leidyi]